MRTSPLFSVLLVVTTLLFSTSVFAQKKHKVVKQNHKKTHIVHTHKTHVVKHTKPKTHVVRNSNTHKTHVVKTTKVVHHKTGVRLKALPVGYNRITVGNAHYYHHLGNYYRWQSNLGSYVVVRPPIGTVISTIPTGYTVVRYNGLNHHVLNGVYYRPEYRNGVKVFVVARV